MSPLSESHKNRNNSNDKIPIKSKLKNPKIIAKIHQILAKILQKIKIKILLKLNIFNFLEITIHLIIYKNSSAKKKKNKRHPYCIATFNFHMDMENKYSFNRACDIIKIRQTQISNLTTLSARDSAGPEKSVGPMRAHAPRVHVSN